MGRGPGEGVCGVDTEDNRATERRALECSPADEFYFDSHARERSSPGRRGERRAPKDK
jgi:hypothetical protein